MSVMVQVHSVSPLKALIEVNLVLRSLRWRFYCVPRLLEKIYILLHTKGLVKTEMASTVCTVTKNEFYTYFR